MITRWLLMTAGIVFLALPGVVHSKGTGTAYGPVAMNPDTSAPDAWGYTYVRSTDPGGPVYNWIDITTIGTEVTGLTDDNNVGPFPMGFAFQYYWYTFNNFRVGSNGYITPGNQTSNFSAPFAQLPNLSPPNDIIAGLVGDLVFTGQAGAAGQCFYWSNQVDTLIVSYIAVTEWEQTINPALHHTFQIILSNVDSSITFQYGPQTGSFSQTNNNRLCIGIENQTGTIGLNYGYSTTPPHPFMPTDSFAVKIKRTANTGLSVTDAGIVGGFNADNLGQVVQKDEPDSIRVVAKNFGTITLSNVRLTHAITKSGQPTFRDTVFLTTMDANSEVLVTFPRVFTPDTTGAYTATFAATVSGDQGPSNNTKVAEIQSVDMVVGQNFEVGFETGTSGGSINWIGGGGMGVHVDLPYYPVLIQNVKIHITSITASNLLVEIMADSGGLPGSLLGSKNVTAVTLWNTIDFSGDSIRIDSGAFFVGGRGQMAFTYETLAPISYRSWEYTGGWTQYRSRDLQDVLIRVTVKPTEPIVGVGGGGETVPEAYALHQNFPNPFNPNTAIRYELPNEGRVVLRVYNILGQEVRTLVNAKQAAGVQTVRWDGRNNLGQAVSSGIYLYRLEAGSYVKTLKMTLLK